MRVIFVSDTHNKMHLVEIPEGDLLIHCGDMTSDGTLEELLSFNEQFMRNPHPHKVVIAGNHDLLLFDDPDARRLFDPSIHYLMDSEVVIDGVKIFGQPWVPGLGAANFNAFTLPPGSAELAARRREIPEDTDILVVHSPACGILDGSGKGCSSLRWRIEEIRPQVVACGHVHSGYGEYTDPDSGVHFVNAAICDARNKATNPPLVLDIG